jgi:tetratricopeptide (TPR) repeat protein
MAALDSRAMVYFRLGRMDDALADLNAALDIVPDMPAAVYLRGIVLSHRGDASGAKRDLDVARILSPRIAEDYDRWGVKPKG